MSRISRPRRPSKLPKQSCRSGARSISQPDTAAAYAGVAFPPVAAGRYDGGTMERPIVDRNRRYTLEEYFALDGVSEVRYEYWDGLLVPQGGWETDADGHILGMAGGTDVHNDIVVNLIGEVSNALRGTPCKVGGPGLRVRSPRSGRYHYPDVSVTCGPRVFDPPESRATIANPQVLVEVLSKSTADMDRGEKFREYIEIASLQQYVLVGQDQPLVHTFLRTPEGGWIVGPWAEGLGAAVAFPSLGVTVPLAEVYAGVTFHTAPPPPTATAD
jgi:Uma2 family endonuclease